MNEPTRQFHAIADAVLVDLLAADPVTATWLGDHAHDSELPDLTDRAVGARVQRMDDHLTALDAVDDVELDVADYVDLEILRSALTKSAFDDTELREQTWNPMAWNPGTSLHLLLSRDFASLAERLTSAAGRLNEIPRFLADARATLQEMPQIHVETAIAQFAGTRALIEGQLAPLLAENRMPGGAIESALEAMDDFTSWLGEQLPVSRRDPRLGERLYGAVLWHRLDDGTTPGSLLEDAHANLDLVSEQIREVACEYLGETGHDIVERALAQVAADFPVSNDTVLSLVEEANTRSRDFAISHDLVSVPEIDVRVIEMPEIHRGVAVAYCDAPGPLETAPVPTFVAVSPTPADWSADRTESFYREYNGVQLHDLTIHEAFPGHVLQLAHARALKSASPVRKFGMSGVFVEGWAVYAEQLMIDRGYTPTDDPRSALAIRLQQLKMQLRMTINAILDVSVHAGDMSEGEGMSLMRDRGFQEEGEAVGKWRRALLTSGQLPTYFVGYKAVTEIASDLRVLHSDWSDRQVHDLMLSQGSPAPRHLRTLLGI
jgi:uncharacterized protein (DUF885 family)